MDVQRTLVNKYGVPGMRLNKYGVPECMECASREIRMKRILQLEIGIYTNVILLIEL